MRIVSKFKDYYDNGMKYGQDKTHTYVRNTKEVPLEIKSIYLSTSGSYKNKPEDIIYFYGVVGFCGDIYPFIKWHYNNDNAKSCITYDKDEIVELTTRHIDNKKRLFYNKKSYINEELEYFNNLKNNKKLKSLFLKYRVPIFSMINESLNYISKPNTLELNSNLSNLEFYRVVDPFQAYQKIDMFIGNELAPRDEIEVPVGSDKVIAASKGYDKWSFRKEPQVI